MSIEQADLIGWISPIGQGLGFCVPIFSNSARSNLLLVQQVDDGGNITNFLPFYTEQLYHHTDLPTITKQVGESAFWYFDLGESFPVFGTADEIRAKFHRGREKLMDWPPHIALQIALVCGLEKEEISISRRVFDALKSDMGLFTAHSWLDANVLTPRARGRILNLLRSKMEFRASELLSEVMALSEEKIRLYIPEWLRTYLDSSGWQTLEQEMRDLGIVFSLGSAEIRFIEGFGTPSDLLMRAPSVAAMKRDAVAAFARSKGLQLLPISRSYFVDMSGRTRVVCTLSSRYEGKGKRKYWFGFHEIWNRWLEDSDDAFVILGCLDTRLGFSLPLPVVRKLIPNLRATGSGKDRYWHLDIVDQSGDQNLLDVPHVGKLDLSEFRFRF